jgi:hypothetical protein
VATCTVSSACRRCSTRVTFGSSELGDTFCPADKIQHNVKISQLPCCYAILTNLPATAKPASKPTQGVYRCQRHPEKCIKFMCEEHRVFLCTNCVLDHTGVGHRVVSFKADCIEYFLTCR